MIMQEEYLRQLLDTKGYYLVTKERIGIRRNSVYLLAQKKHAPNTQQVYLGTRRHLPILSEEEVIEKIGAAS